MEILMSQKLMRYQKSKTNLNNTEFSFAPSFSCFGILTLVDIISLTCFMGGDIVDACGVASAET